MQEKNFSELEGKILTKIISTDDEIIFTVSQKEKYHLYHVDDCCESVTVEDICGDLDDLIGHKILSAVESESSDDSGVDSVDESYTWTFYNISTIKGSVTIRWYGTSNGYYSERVDFDRMEDDE